MKVNVCMDYWAVGGAERFWQRLSRVVKQHQWIFTTEVDPEADVVIYSNNDKFYHQAKALNKPAVLRITGPRSYSLPQHNDLAAVICTSQKSYELSKHERKVLIYNGVDISKFDSIQPIECDLLYGCARVGLGQKPEVAIKYAKNNNRHITITGSRQHLAEKTYNVLKKKYPEVNWTGLIEEDEMFRYIKGCKAGIMPTSVHGVSNFIIECVAADKPIINLGGVEIPDKKQIDIGNAAYQYNKLLSHL